MVMDARFSLPLACCVLAVSLASTAAKLLEREGTSTATNPIRLIGANTTTVAQISNQTHSTAMAASLNVTTIKGTVSTPVDFTSNVTSGGTLPHDSTQEMSTLVTPTAALTESPNMFQTSQQTPTWTPVTDTTSVTNTVPGIFHSTEPNTGVTTTTVTPNSTSNTPPSIHQSTEDPHHTTNATSGTSMTDTMNKAKKGLGLDHSEKILTAIFSGVLGVFVLGLATHQIIRCKQRRKQYSHQPLTENNVDGFLIEDDTLVISGGLYDGHNIYDPSTTTEDDFITVHSQPTLFRLEFLSEEQ